MLRATFDSLSDIALFHSLVAVGEQWQAALFYWHSQSEREGDVQRQRETDSLIKNI